MVPVEGRGLDRRQVVPSVLVAGLPQAGAVLGALLSSLAEVGEGVGSIGRRHLNEKMLFMLCFLHQDAF